MLHTVRANMAGTIIEVLVKTGDIVADGQDIVMIESMKMQLAIQGDRAGKVITIRANAGDFVNDGDALVDIEA